ncbi:MAG: transporter substrate-binding domain-containing protein [Alkalibacterium sp.]|nr:transporter substrate-binding domain-containing protein [Alkalibacterium sp.]
MISGRTDAIMVDRNAWPVLMNQNPYRPDYKVLEENFGNEEYAIGFRQEDDELREQFNASLERLMEDGTYDDIYKTWFSE